MARRKSPDKRIEGILRENSSSDDLVKGLLLWTLKRAHEEPDSVTVAQVGQVLEGAARFKAAGGGDGDELKQLLEMLDDE